MNEDSEVLWRRAERKGWLTADRHKEVRAQYSAETAGIDDLALFARYVMNAYGDRLFDDLLAEFGRSAGPDDRWQLLLTSLNTVHEMAATAPALQTFGLYHFDQATYHVDCAGGGDGVLAAEAIRAVANTVLHPTASAGTRAASWRGTLPRTPYYHAVGALVREYLGRDGIDSDERALLTGPGYARLVFEANSAIADSIGERGLVDGVHVRLDDDWQGGGTWRTIRYEGAPPVESRYGALTALGLGYTTTSGAAGIHLTLKEPESEVPERASDRAWRMPLRYIDLYYGDLPLTSEAVAMFSADATDVRLSFSDGARVEEISTKPLDRGRRMIHEIDYPPEFVAGTIVGYSVGFGGRAVSLRAYPLPVPVSLEGRTVRFEFNEQIFRRDLRLEPLPSATFRSARTLTDQINEVFRRRGRETADGGRALRAEEVVAAMVGPATDPTGWRPIVLRLQQGDFEYRSPEYVWHPKVSRRTSPRERTRILAARDRERARLDRMIAPHTVQMSIRHYMKNKPTRTKIESYLSARIYHHAEHRLPEALPPGCTWVKPYSLGVP